MPFVREHVTKSLTRSSGWRKVRKEHIKAHPECAACGRKNGLEVHHIVPFQLDPSLELEPSNLITLCDKATKCHLSFGHLGDWKSYNDEVVGDSKWFRNKVDNRPEDLNEDTIHNAS